MPSAVTLIRSAALSDVAEYAYAATAPAEARLTFLPDRARWTRTARRRPPVTTLEKNDATAHQTLARAKAAVDNIG